MGRSLVQMKRLKRLYIAVHMVSQKMFFYLRKPGINEVEIALNMVGVMLKSDNEFSIMFVYSLFKFKKKKVRLLFISLLYLCVLVIYNDVSQKVRACIKEAFIREKQWSNSHNEIPVIKASWHNKSLFEISVAQ